MEEFSPEIITMLGVGIAIIGLVLQQGRRLDRRIDALALQMDERDRRTDDRFEQVNEQYRHLTDQTNERFRHLTEQISEQFRQHNEQTNERFREMNERFREMNEQFREMNEQFRDLSGRVARVEGKFDLLEAFVEHRKEPPAEAAE